MANMKNYFADIGGGFRQRSIDDQLRKNNGSLNSLRCKYEGVRSKDGFLPSERGVFFDDSFVEPYDPKV